MKKKKGINIVGYGTKVAVGGIGLGMIEQAGGTGTNMGASYIGGMSKAITPMANIQGTNMVLGSLKQIKMPKLKGGYRKKRR